MSKRRSIIWYHPDLKEQARDLRNNCTYFEKMLWGTLKGKQMKGYDFHRQKPIGHFIVDFFCNELMLAIEIDGSVHQSEDSKIKDIRRQEAIEEYGISFLRFNEVEIRNNLPGVLKTLLNWINKSEKEK